MIEIFYIIAEISIVSKVIIINEVIESEVLS